MRLDPGCENCDLLQQSNPKKKMKSSGRKRIDKGTACRKKKEKEKKSLRNISTSLQRTIILASLEFSVLTIET